MRKFIIFVLLVSSIALLSACTSAPDDDDNRELDEMLELTIEELAMYNGEDGKDAYIAVDGVIYDVTGVAAWSGGTHNGGMAGTDVSELIENAPHGTSVLDDLVVVGTIVE